MREREFSIDTIALPSPFTELFVLELFICVRHHRHCENATKGDPLTEAATISFEALFEHFCEQHLRPSAFKLQRSSDFQRSHSIEQNIGVSQLNQMLNIERLCSLHFI